MNNDQWPPIEGNGPNWTIVVLLVGVATTLTGGYLLAQFFL